MDGIRAFIIEDFVIAEAGLTADRFLEPLVAGAPVVVMDSGRFSGILTMEDVVRNPKARVEDAVSPKPMINASDALFPVLVSMVAGNFNFLPVSEVRLFKGVISRMALWNAYLQAERHHVEGDAVVQLRRELASRDQFVSIVSHDIGNLFNQVLGGLELVERGVTAAAGDRMYRALRLTRASAEQVQSTLQEMLLWSRLNPAAAFTPEWVSLQRAFAHTVDQVRLAADLKGIEVVSLLDRELQIWADRNMLACILRNVAYNAVKFTGKNGRVWLDAREREAGVDILVGDSGVGMSDEMKAQLFKAGISAPGTQQEIGSGIGLVICKDFVERHHGEIRVHSEPGKGTQVIISLPAQ